MLNLKVQAPTFTELLGVKGAFKVPNSKIRLHYFLTIASSQTLYANKAFLNHLKPLRDYLDIGTIRGLDDVLQRDVDDARVAGGVVHYLLKSKIDSPVFFPSIVVVLQPKERTSGDESYPRPKKLQESNKVYFSDLWFYEQHKSGEDLTPISTLGIDLEKVIPLIIDGQHRTAAFQLVSGNYNFSGANVIYEKFYESYTGNIPNEFQADLPVTAVWFESLSEEDEDSPIDVKDYARKMFVDINQSSQTIAKSRKLILDDTSPKGFFTRITYDRIAQNAGFQVGGRLSLFHAGFDYPRTLGRSADWLRTSFFIPELMAYALENLLFGPSTNDETGIKNAKMLKEDKLFADSFDDLLGAGFFNESFDVEEDIEENQWYLVNKERAGSLRTRFENVVCNPLISFMESNVFYQRIMETSSDIERGFQHHATSQFYSQSQLHYVWQKVFCGGEGLYYSLTGSSAPSTSMYRKAISEIVDHYNAELAKKYVAIDVTAFNDSLNSVAYFVGFVMSSKSYFRYLLAKDTMTTFDAAIDDLVGKNEQVDWDALAKMISLLKNQPYLKNVDPKSWPRYRDIHLRFLVECGAYEFGPENNLEDIVFNFDFFERGKAHALQIGENWSAIKDDWLFGGSVVRVNPQDRIDAAKTAKSIIEDIWGQCSLKSVFKSMDKYQFREHI